MGQQQMQNTTIRSLKSYIGKPFTVCNSKAGRWLNYTMLVVEEGYIEVSVLVREEMCNPANQLHGGMTAMITDELCGLCFYTLGSGTIYTTINLHVDYLFSAHLGETILIKAKVLRSGKRLANVECFIYNVDEKLLAHATTNLMNTGHTLFDLIK